MVEVSTIATNLKHSQKSLGMINSMTEEKVYENAHAERLNGIIKNNYLYPYGPTNMTSLRKTVRQGCIYV